MKSHHRTISLPNEDQSTMDPLNFPGQKPQSGNNCNEYRLDQNSDRPWDNLSQQSHF